MKVTICKGKNCSGKFSKYITDRLKQDIEKFEFKWVTIEETPCMGKCKTAPNIMFDAEEMKYADPIKASKKMITKLKNESNN